VYSALNQLAYGYRWSICPAGSSLPAIQCTSWIFLDASTGKMIIGVSGRGSGGQTRLDRQHHQARDSLLAHGYGDTESGSLLHAFVPDAPQSRGSANSSRRSRSMTSNASARISSALP
jgi:hypothetical protein